MAVLARPYRAGIRIMVCTGDPAIDEADVLASIID
jgi:hypothetical protein